MLINILLPYKEKFSINKASSVSLTVANNLQFSKYKKQIRVFGHNLKDPMYKDNFVGIENSWNFLKSKNENIAQEFCKVINNDQNIRQLIEIHNRPNYVDTIHDKVNSKIILYFHNNPLTIAGSKLKSEPLIP